MESDASNSGIVHTALDALLLVVARTAEDLRTFHDVVSKAPVASASPFPRVAVATTHRIIDHLKKVEEKLQEVLAALGLPPRNPEPEP